jgi:hypothetical protein
MNLKKNKRKLHSKMSYIEELNEGLELDISKPKKTKKRLESRQTLKSRSHSKRHKTPGRAMSFFSK